MVTYGKTIRLGTVAALLLAGITSGVQGQGVPVGGASVGGEGRGLIQIRGRVVCTRCSLEEARVAQPDGHPLYQFTHRRGRVVFRVSKVTDPRSWVYFAWPPRLQVRAKDSLFAQLSAEENLLKEVEITGLLNNARNLDIFAITIHG